jgi:glucokinase
MSVSVLALDLGGTKIASAIVGSDGGIVWCDVASTKDGSGASGPERLSQIALNALEQSGSQPSAIGVAIPAVLSPVDDSVIWAPNIPEWDGLDIRSALRSVLPVPVAIEYDGHAAAIGEGWIGAGLGVDDFVVVAVGTGIGCGIVANGSVVRGVSRLAGAAGWMIMSDEGTPWERLSTSEGITDLLNEALSLFPDSVLSASTTPDAVAIFDAAESGDLAAKETVGRLARRLGIGIANLVSVLNPARIILTGGIGTRDTELIPGIASAVREYAQPVSGADVEILTSPLGTSSVLLGAARAALCAMEDDHPVDEKGTDL